MHPMGPGFFIFFQSPESMPVIVTEIIKEARDDAEVVELIKIIFSFLENGGEK